LLQGTNMLGVLLFPVAASTVNLTGDTTYNFNLPGLPGEVTVSGRVTDSGGRGVADVAVSAFSQSLTGAANISFAAGVTTDANGNYSIKVLSGTAYQILFYPPIPTP
jgi:protocatechuate 3,4-dioxygenase beta subunit